MDFETLVYYAKYECSRFQRLTRSERIFLSQMSSWNQFSQIAFAEDEFQVLMLLDIIDLSQVLYCIQLFSLATVYPSLNEITVKIIDNTDRLDEMLKNIKILKFLESSNSFKILAHVFSKFPKLMEMNCFKTKSKVRINKFNQDFIEKWK